MKAGEDPMEEAPLAVKEKFYNRRMGGVFKVCCLRRRLKGNAISKQLKERGGQTFFNRGRNLLIAS
jgi:hypothetical protein